MTSMAAAIAAALPTTQIQAPVIEKPTYEAIPASMSKAVDIEADIPITRVQIDTLVRVPNQIFNGFAHFTDGRWFQKS